MRFPIHATLVALVIVSAAGCKSSGKSVMLARDAFASGDLQTSRTALDSLSQTEGPTNPTIDLDLAMVELASGNPRAAERRLRKIRDRFDALPKLDLVGEATAIAADDTRRNYRPAGHEQVMVRTMLAVCSLAGDTADAESYLIQAAKRQTDLGRDAEDRGLTDIGSFFQPIAFAPYLRGAIREATHRDYDDAARAYQLVSSVQPDFHGVQADIQRASEGVHSRPDHGVLYVIGCVGRGPVLGETVAPTTSTALSIAGTMLNPDDDSTDSHERRPLPNVASVKIPHVYLPPCRVAAISTHVNGELKGTTQTITSVADLAAKHLSASMPWIIARAVVRRVAKEATVATVGKQIGLEGSAASMFQFAAGSVWAESERADTRCWGLLPRDIQIMRIELPVGKHTLLLSSVDAQGTALGAGEIRQVEIENGRNHYLVAIAPDNQVFVANSLEQYEGAQMKSH